MSALPYALACARMHWWVIPIIDVARDQATEPGKRGKRPCPWLAPHGIDDATVDVSVLKAWFADPALGLGIVCGPSGLLVVDVDPRNGGDASLRELVAGREWPVTPTACTGGGGWHHVYRRPIDPKTGELVPLRGKLVPGVDLKHGRGYVCAAPTVHESGEAYRWHPDALPSKVPLAELPTWALELARQPEYVAPPPRPIPREGPSPSARASRYLATMSPSISGAGGHDALYKAAIVLIRGFQLSEAEALGILLAEFNPRCQPPWAERDIRHKIKQATNNARYAWGYLL
jgi:hypothetical protein